MDLLIPGCSRAGPALRIDTIQGVLYYKRAGTDSRITWTPPSALRRIDLILLDEGSQYEDREWVRLLVVIDNGIPGPRFYYFCVVLLFFNLAYVYLYIYIYTHIYIYIERDTHNIHTTCMYIRK